MTPRDAIAKIVASNMFGDHRVSHRHPFDNEVADAILLELRSAIPTEEMIAAGERAVDDFYNGGKSDDMRGAILACWRGMMTAASRAAAAEEKPSGPSS